jgi:uroporphyrin-III C-methyltransferase
MPSATTVAPDPQTVTETSAELESAEPALSSSAGPAPRKRSGGRWLLWLLVMGALAAGGYWAWLHYQAERTGTGMARPAEPSTPPWEPAIASAIAGSNAQSDSLAAELAQLRERQRALEQRLSDLLASNSVLREELLGMAERATMLEQALIRQAQARQEGAQALRLDEIDFLLQMAAERLHLFADLNAAIRALQLAQDSLEQVREPLFAGVRQTLAQELALLQSQPDEARSRLRAELQTVQRTLPHLPLQEFDAPDPEAEAPSRLRELIGTLVTVRRIDDAGATLSPLGRATQLSVLQLQLGLAQAALETNDESAWEASLWQALTIFDSLYDPSAMATTQIRERLLALQHATPAAAPPPLGAALQELRNLRATRQLGRAPLQQSPPPAASPPQSTPIAAQPGAPAAAATDNAVDEAAVEQELELERE